MELRSGRDPIRLGMIGCGMISHAHGRAAMKSDKGIVFRACASRRREVAEAWAKEYGAAAAYTDFRKMLTEQYLDGVIIATCPTQHREHIEAALQAGIKYVLCEKALTVSGADAVSVWQEATRRSAIVLEGFMYRYHPAMAELQSIMDSGQLGAIDNIRGVCHMADPGPVAGKSPSWWQRPEAGGGVPHDFACYPVDAINTFAGAAPKRVVASGSINQVSGVIDRLYGHIEYENGVVGLVECSRRAVFSQAFEISGTQGRLSMPVAWSISSDAEITRSQAPRFLELESKTLRIPQPGQYSGGLVDLPVFKIQIEHFAALIRGEEEPKVPLEGSVVTAMVVEALVTSFREGRPVDLSIPDQIKEFLHVVKS